MPSILRINDNFLYKYESPTSAMDLFGDLSPLFWDTSLPKVQVKAVRETLFLPQFSHLFF